ncbi:MAG: NAD-dependent dehydratase [Phyllobacteriaceae bacterium]|nr:NAD-dependent dehydratase [Phyllobacteriaceae bacterium]MBA92274.1 NAD-dependent dehydratase [Phyllobacteriaceae bacterium]
MLNRILITGAAGGVGRQLRPLIRPLTHHLRLSDIVPVTDAGDGEEAVTCDLSDAAAVSAMVKGCDAIVHLGGVSTEQSWAKIRPANIDGVFHLYEAARAHGGPRIIFASSNHVVGFHGQDEHLDNTAPARPDSLYGVSKCFGEALASMYHDKFGIETAIVRIGSCFPDVKDRRMLSTWLSAADLALLIERCLTVPRLGCPVIYGVSNNDTVWWDNSRVSHLGWKPRDSSEKFRAAVEAAGPAPDRDDPLARYQGGAFTAEPIHED